MRPAWRRETLAVALVGVIAFLPFIRGVASGASFYFRDLALHFLPLRRLALDGLRGGEIHLWNPYLHEGLPLSLPAVGYPLDLLQLLRPDEVGVSLALALHVPLAAMGFYALARRLLAAPPTAAAGGALVYALGGFVLSTVNLYVYVEAAAWCPLVVLTLARVMAGGGRRTVAGAGLVLAVALSTIGVEIVAQAVVAGLVLGLRPGEGRTRASLGSAGGALALGALIAAPVLVLLGAQMGDSARGQGFETRVVLAHSVHPFTLLQSLVAGLFGNLSNLANEWWGQNFFPRGFPYILSLYVGPAAVGLAFVGAGGRHALRHRLALLTLAGLVLCLGRWAGLAPVADALPPVRAFRYPVKAFFTVHLAISLLVSLGLAHLSSSEARRAWTRLAVAAGVLGGALALAPLAPRVAPIAMDGFAGAFFPPGFRAATRTALLSRVLMDAAAGGAIALAVAMVAVLARAGRLRHATLLVVALVAGDLLRAGSGLNPMVTGAFFTPSKELSESLDSFREGRVYTCPFEQSERYRQARRARGTGHEMWTFALALESLTSGCNLPLRVPTALSPDLTMLVPPERVLPEGDPGCRNLDGLVPRLRRAGVRTVLSIDPLLHPELRPQGRNEAKRLAPLSVFAYQLADPLPRLQVAARVAPVNDAAQGARKAAEPGFLRAGGAAVEGERAGNGVRGRVQGARLGNDEMEIAVDASADTVLVIRDGWSPGWTAEVNGAPATLERADGRHRAVEIPAGHSRVVLRYRPSGLGLSLAGSLLGLGALIGLSWRRGISPATPALAVGLGLVAAPAHAALDPGTGSYGFQMTATIAVAAVFALRAFWPRLRAFVARRRRPGSTDAG